MSLESEQNILIQALTEKGDKRTQDQLKSLEKFMSKVAFFKEIISHYGITGVQKLVIRLQLKIYQPEQTIMKSGDKGDIFFVIIKGLVGLWIVLPSQDQQFELRELKSMGVGQSFGEMALLSEKSYRTATIIAKYKTYVAILHKQDFFDTIGNNYGELMNSKLNYITQMPFFKNWHPREIKTISYQFTMSNYSIYQQIYDSNTTANYVYFIQSGEFKLLSKISYQKENKIITREVEVCVFGYPEIFGLESYYDNQKYLGRIECISSHGSVYQIAITDLSLRLNNSQNKNLLKKMAGTQVEFIKSRLNILEQSIKKQQKIQMNQNEKLKDGGIMNRTVKQISISQMIDNKQLNNSYQEDTDTDLNARKFQLLYDAHKEEEKLKRYKKKNYINIVRNSSQLQQTITEQQRKQAQPLISQLRSKKASYGGIDFQLRQRVIAQDQYELRNKNNQNELLESDPYKFNKTDLRGVNKMVKTIISSKQKQPLSYSIDKGQQEILEQHRQYRVILNRQQTQEKLNSPLRRKKIQTLMSRQNSISKKQNSPNSATLRIQNLLKRTNTNYDYEKVQSYSQQMQQQQSSMKQISNIHNTISNRKQRAISEFTLINTKTAYN